MFVRKDKYKSIMPDQPNSKAPTRPNSIQPKKRRSNMFKNRTAPVPLRGKHSLSLKPEKADEPLEAFIPDNVGCVHISDEVLDSIVDQVEERMLKRSKKEKMEIERELR
ncbi:hypothetical protein [Lactiplantibacillus plantarum]|uniref:hypothetical protein n=1 Tax=Lactiplantibacillus plantarum TaxID=1590 RepID=UPI000D58BB21|nr:hypothetical protein [Lactiplantibacillus plantarum]AWI40679.1 hypothetical protein LpLQ80_09130 [Lactiplantibacillus plantarum]